MSQILKFFFATVLIFALFLSATNGQSKTFLILLNFYLFYTMFHILLVTFVFCISISEFNECYEDTDCPIQMCGYPFNVDCVGNKCTCVYNP